MPGVEQAQGISHGSRVDGRAGAAAEIGQGHCDRGGNIERVALSLPHQGKARINLRRTMSTDAAKPGDEISVGGVKVRPGLTLGLYALLALSFGAALWAQANPAEVPPFVARGAPWVFLVFAVGFAAYRFALVASRRYGAFKAFFQIFVAVAVFLLLLFQPAPSAERSGATFGAPRRGEATGGGQTVKSVSNDLTVLFRDPDPQVRALAAELSRYRGGGPEVPRALIPLLVDPDAAVKTVAHDSLVQFNSGQDLGNDPKVWGERFP
ncbi:MAG: hypothetical protein JNK82_09305 [Myxococcaceae bacterium]|nr:hypothetical protein [Myxococcaceae bacterium]